MFDHGAIAGLLDLTLGAHELPLTDLPYFPRRRPTGWAITIDHSDFFSTTRAKSRAVFCAFVNACFFGCIVAITTT